MAVSRAATVLLFLLSIVVTWQLSSIEHAWRFLLALGAGTGLVSYSGGTGGGSMPGARSVRWRFRSSCRLRRSGWSPTGFRPRDPNADAVVMLITVGCTTIAWIAATFLTKPEPDAILDSFYTRVRPGGPAWEHVSRRLGYGREKIPGGSLAWANWIGGIIAVYASLFGIGKIVFGDTALGVGLLAIAALAFLWIARSFREETPTPQSASAMAPVGGD